MAGGASYSRLNELEDVQSQESQTKELIIIVTKALALGRYDNLAAKTKEPASCIRAGLYFSYEL